MSKPKGVAEADEDILIRSNDIVERMIYKYFGRTRAVELGCEPGLALLSCPQMYTDGSSSRRCACWKLAVVALEEV